MSTFLSPTGTTSPPPPYEPRRPCIAVVTVLERHTFSDMFPITSAIVAEHIPVVSIGRRDMLNASEIITNVQPSAVLIIDACLYGALCLNLWNFLLAYACAGGTVVFMGDFPLANRQPSGLCPFAGVGLNWDREGPCRQTLTVNREAVPLQTAKKLEAFGPVRVDATPMEGVAKRDRWMGCSECSTIGGHDGCSGGAVVAYSQVEGGAIGYVGFADDSKVLATCVLGMCGLID